MALFCAEHPLRMIRTLLGQVSQAETCRHSCIAVLEAVAKHSGPRDSSLPLFQRLSRCLVRHSRPLSSSRSSVHSFPPHFALGRARSRLAVVNLLVSRPTPCPLALVLPFPPRPCHRVRPSTRFHLTSPSLSLIPPPRSPRAQTCAPRSPRTPSLPLQIGSARPVGVAPILLCASATPFWRFSNAAAPRVRLAVCSIRLERWGSARSGGISPTPGVRPARRLCAERRPRVVPGARWVRCSVVGRVLAAPRGDARGARRVPGCARDKHAPAPTRRDKPHAPRAGDSPESCSAPVLQALLALAQSRAAGPAVARMLTRICTVHGARGPSGGGARRRRRRRGDGPSRSTGFGAKQPSQRCCSAARRR